MAKKLAPLTRKTLRGVWHALIVPWTKDDKLDAKHYVADIKKFKGTGVSGIYTGGTTGEFYAQDDATYAKLTELTVETGHAIGVPVQIGASALSTRTTRERIKVALKNKADALQIALPFWLELRDEEVTRFVLEIAETAGKTPIILYLTSRSKRKLAPKLFGELAKKVPTFIGTKDTGSTPEQVKEQLAEAPDIAVFGGESFYQRQPVGGTGGYCSITGINARYVVEYYNAAASGDMAKAKVMNDKIERLLNEVLLKFHKEEGLMDSAIDRIQRVVGGGDVGLQCQSPYLSGGQRHVKEVISWLKANAPEILPA